MYDNCAMDECEELFKHLQYKDFSELRYNVPKLALQANIKRAKAADYAKEIIKIAEKSLRRNQTGDTLFLDEIREYTEKGLSPADIIQKNWNGSWNKDLRKLIKYLNSKN